MEREETAEWASYLPGVKRVRSQLPILAILAVLFGVLIYAAWDDERDSHCWSYDGTEREISLTDRCG